MTHPLTPISLLLSNRLGPDYHMCASWSVHVGLHRIDYNAESSSAAMSMCVFFRTGNPKSVTDGSIIVAHFSGTVAAIEEQAAEWLSVGAALASVGAVKEAA